MHLVNAQQARRILDRLVGYELSPVLWKKVRPGLSAGRVQSVAVRLIVEREREILNFESSYNFKVSTVFEAKTAALPAELNVRLKDTGAVNSLFESCESANFSITSIDQKPSTRNPGSPFITSSLQQEAARRLGFSVKQTMTLAQRLYESGHITYMRTDSTTLSSFAMNAAETYIKQEFGKQYHKSRQYKTKNDSAQEAHEAIRPTDFSKKNVGGDEQQKKLYDLIWRRALASQMSAAAIDRTDIIITISNRDEKFLAKGEVLKFDGYLKLYGGGKEDIILPRVTIGDSITPREIDAIQTYAKPKARYSEASLVNKLEELGIGRPSTYAPTISTIQSRGYVEKGDLEGSTRDVIKIVLKNNKISRETESEKYGADRNKLLPTPLADVTTDFLVKNFPTIVDYDFTAHVEGDFDSIADGKDTWERMIKDFYGRFHPLVQKSENVSREESTQTKILGNDPKSGKPIMARYGRYGPMLQRGETESENKPDFTTLPAGTTLETVTFEQALEMFKLPRVVGKTIDNEEIRANIGRFGPYIQVGRVFVSIKGIDPLAITEDEARELYAAKQQELADKYILEFKNGIKVVKGQYGPYVTDGKKNAKIPKDVDPVKLTEAECKKLLATAPTKKRSFRKRKTA